MKQNKGVPLTVMNRQGDVETKVRQIQYADTLANLTEVGDKLQVFCHWLTGLEQAPNIKVIRAEAIVSPDQGWVLTCLVEQQEQNDLMNAVELQVLEDPADE